MSRFSPEELKLALAKGILCFPATHTTVDYEFDETLFREHLRWLSGYGAAGIFPAGGAGEFFALTPEEVHSVTRATVDEATPGVPVVAPAGYGTAMASQMAIDAEAAGADGIFLLPPYLTEVDTDGLVAHVKAVCDSTALGVILYHRANAHFTTDAMERLLNDCPNLIGFKDGVGDVDFMVRLIATFGDRLLYIGGMPTAEIYALPYLELGVSTYSSAIYNFAPQWANDFFQAVVARDRDRVYSQIREYVIPFVDIRNRKLGYAVSIIKAGLKAVGRDAGPVRRPLTDLTTAEMVELTALVEKMNWTK